MIKVAFVARNKPALEPTLRTPGRWRDADFFVKPEIIGFDDEGLTAVLACLGFRDHRRGRIRSPQKYPLL